ncbi:MAG TPA: RagB/SusD family nutrient uptake outer membrane protein [Chitinophagaceae bacterium]|nr:RagB/SusD family nutrient uptake outer membrane protein [Chitinophagaceae bacterium]
MLLRKIFAAIIITSSLASCKKVIESEPTHQLDGSTRFETIEDFDFALTGAYALFRSGNYYGSGSNAFVNLPDMMSDNLNETSESLGNYQTLSTWRYAEDEPNIAATWQAAYRIISQANLLLRDIDNFSATDEGAVNRIKGQALAIRAMVHFDLLRYWVEDYDRNSTKPGIPYITVFDYEQKPARGTVKETYDHIESDLQQARGLISNGLDQVINSSGKAYIDIQGVNAIMARVFLYSNQLDSAIKYSTLVINAIPLASRTNFPNIWTDASASEVIWSVSFNAGEGRIGDPVYFVPNNRSSYRPNPALITTYDQVNDIRYSSYFQVRSTRLVLSKYLAKAAQVPRPDGVVNFKAFRTGEMYLIRAEAYARKGGINEGLALADLNSLRAARITGFVSGIETGPALIDAIALERRKELISEGHRWFDLKRTTKTIIRSGCSVFCTLDPADRAWTWPLPIAEINANPTILPQTPGY